jgi:hypothetical protein
MIVMSLPLTDEDLDRLTKAVERFVSDRKDVLQ